LRVSNSAGCSIDSCAAAARAPSSSCNKPAQRS
jgi:hypothetical protein